MNFVKENLDKIYCIIPFFIIGLLIIFALTINKPPIQEEITIDTTFSFYKEKLHDRYINYKKQTNLEDKDIILKVNMGLDTPFYTNPTVTKYTNTNYVLVNKFNYLPNSYVPNNLVILDEYSKPGIKLVKEAYESFKKMAFDASLNNLNLRIVSAYRSYDYQKNLYNNYLKNDSQEIVDTYSARPGFSEHQTGLAIDIDNGRENYNRFHITQEFTWVKENCYKYGFILRYDLGKEHITGYKYEPWHYRYVGTEISEYIYKNNLTFEEYYHQFIG